MGGATCNPGDFASEASVVNVQKGGKGDINDLLSCCHSELQVLPVQVLNHTVMKLVRMLAHSYVHNGGRGSLHSFRTVEFFGQKGGVDFLG